MWNQLTAWKRRCRITGSQKKITKMIDDNYKRTITVDASPEDAYIALTTGYANWWTPCDRGFNKVGDRIKFTFPPNVSYWTFEARILKPNRIVELRCVEAYHKITDKPDASVTEWLGSTVRWKIKSHPEQTDIHFTHYGLTPELDCYDVCESGWDMFFVESLKSYLDTGVGKPHQTESK